MLRFASRSSLNFRALACSGFQARSVASALTATSQPEGDISSAFASLSGQGFRPLDPRFAHLKRRIITGHEDALQASWTRLLDALKDEIPLVAAKGPSIVPEIDFKDLDKPPAQFSADHRKRGVAVIRNVIPRDEATQLNGDLQAYIKANPHTKAYPPDAPQVFELYWSPTQMRVRSHPNLLKTQKFLMSYWHSKDPNAGVSLGHPISYADRLRIRQPGDTKFVLGPHVDGGSCERWEERAQASGDRYDSIFDGKWEAFDPWEVSSRLDIPSNCSAVRLHQAWLALSSAGPYEGTMLVNPILGLATAYYLLRPFFSPRTSMDLLGSRDEFLHARNWKLSPEQDSWLHGASPGQGQELRDALHPHLDLEKTMVHVPHVQPGDYVSWHCDTPHAVDKTHVGSSESSVLYIPACPLTETDAQYLVRQRDALLRGVPSPDFPGGEGESKHIGRPTVDDLLKTCTPEGLRAFGLNSWDSTEDGLSPAQVELMDRANKILGFYT